MGVGSYCSKSGAFGNDLHFPSGEIRGARSFVHLRALAAVVVGFRSTSTAKTLRYAIMGYNGCFWTSLLPHKILMINLLRP